MTMTVEIKNADLLGSLNGLKLTGGQRDGTILKPQESTEVYIHSGTDSNVTLSEVALEATEPVDEQTEAKPSEEAAA